MRIAEVLKRPIERMPALLSGWYDEKIMRGLFWGWYMDTAREAALEVERGEILDIGTGAGYLPLFIALGAPDITVKGIDSSRRMIGRARRHAVEMGAGNNVSFQEGEAVNLDFDDESFHMVLNTMAVHCLRQPVDMLNEAHRVLRPGGKIWLYDIRGGEREGRFEMFRKVRRLSPWFLKPFITEKSMKDGGYSSRQIDSFFGRSRFRMWQYREEGMFFRFEGIKELEV